MLFIGLSYYYFLIFLFFNIGIALFSVNEEIYIAFYLFFFLSYIYLYLYVNLVVYMNDFIFSEKALITNFVINYKLLEKLYEFFSIDLFNWFFLNFIYKSLYIFYYINDRLLCALYYNVNLLTILHFKLYMNEFLKEYYFLVVFLIKNLYYINFNIFFYKNLYFENYLYGDNYFFWDIFLGKLGFYVFYANKKEKEELFYLLAESYYYDHEVISFFQAELFINEKYEHYFVIKIQRFLYWCYRVKNKYKLLYNVLNFFMYISLEIFEFIFWNIYLKNLIIIDENFVLTLNNKNNLIFIDYM